MRQGFPADARGGYMQRSPNGQHSLQQHQLMELGPQGSPLSSPRYGDTMYGPVASPYDMPQASLSRQQSPRPLGQPAQVPDVVHWDYIDTSKYEEPYDQRSLRKMLKDAPPQQRAELSHHYRTSGAPELKDSCRAQARPRRSPRQRAPNYGRDAGVGQGVERGVRDEMRKQLLAIEQILWLSIDPIAQRLDHQADRHAALLDHFAQQETLLKQVLQVMQGRPTTQGGAQSGGWSSIPSLASRSAAEARETSAPPRLGSPSANWSQNRVPHQEPSILPLGNVSIESEGSLFRPGEEGAVHTASQKSAVAKSVAGAQDLTHKPQKIGRTSTGRSQSIPHGGLLTRIVLSDKFQMLCTVVILLNAGYMGFVADVEIRGALDDLNGHGQPVDISLLKLIMEYAFLGFYAGELVLKLIVFRLAFFTNEEWTWNNFDFVLVVSGLLSVFNLAQDVVWMRTVKAVAKIVRALRAARVVKYFRELRVIILSIANSGKTFLWGIILMSLMAYLCCVVTLSGLTEWLQKEKKTHYDGVPEEVRLSLENNWSSLANAMITQYRTVTGGGPWGLTIEPLRHCDWFYFAVFLMYIAMLMVAVSKLLTGIFVQQANLAAKRDHTEFIRESIKGVFNALDDDESGFVSREEFQACVGFKAARDFLTEMDIRTEDALRLFDMVDEDSSGQIDIDEFILGCQRFSGAAKNFDMAIALTRLDAVSMDIKNVLLFLDDRGERPGYSSAVTGVAPELMSWRSTGSRKHNLEVM